MSIVNVAERYRLNLNVISAVEAPIVDKNSTTGNNTITPYEAPNPQDIELLTALHDIDALVGFSLDGEDIGLDAIVGREEVIKVWGQILEYLGHPESMIRALEVDKRSEDFSYYIGRLATYFSASDDSITSDFGSFEKRHTDSQPHATGPLERNSRGYAVLSNQLIQQQLQQFYNANLSITLRGPKKREENKMVWKRGVSECQFLILDKVRDAYIKSGMENGADPLNTLSLEQIGDDIAMLSALRREITNEVRRTHPLLAEYVDDQIAQLNAMTGYGFSRGRRADTPIFYREAPKARRELRRLVDLLTLTNAATDVTQVDVEPLNFEDL